MKIIKLILLAVLVSSCTTPFIQIGSEKMHELYNERLAIQANLKGDK